MCSDKDITFTRRGSGERGAGKRAGLRDRQVANQQAGACLGPWGNAVFFMAMEAPAAFFHCLDALAAFFNGSGAPVALFHGYTTIHGACCGCNNGAVPRVACGGTCTTVAFWPFRDHFKPTSNGHQRPPWRRRMACLGLWIGYGT